MSGNKYNMQLCINTFHTNVGRMNEAERKVEQTCYLLIIGKMIMHVWPFYLVQTNVIIAANSLCDIYYGYNYQHNSLLTKAIIILG